MQSSFLFGKSLDGFLDDDYTNYSNPVRTYIGDGGDSSDADDDLKNGSTLTIFDANNMLGVLDAEIFHPIDTILMDTTDGRVSLAYERLTHIPRPFAETFAASTHTLDLSHNNLKDLSFLTNFRHLTTLILDQNDTPHEYTVPYLPQLRLLWLNNCRIQNLAAWLRRLKSCCPMLRHLSLFGNPGCMSAFNGGTAAEQLDYRMSVLAALPQLEHLDDQAVTAAQREQALVHRSSSGGGGGGGGSYGSSYGGVGRFAERYGSPRLVMHDDLGKAGGGGGGTNGADGERLSVSARRSLRSEVFVGGDAFNSATTDSSH